MARGWESKHVESQQEARGTPVDAGPREPDALDARRALELARADLQARLERVAGGPQRQMLERALAEVERRLSVLGS
jgi:hypothetical protein